MNKNAVKSLLITILVFAICAITYALISPLLTQLSNPNSASSNITPAASLEAFAGMPQPAVSVGDNWQTYDDQQIGIHIKYPPDWTSARLLDTLGVGFYPPGSSPDLPTPAIAFRFLNQVYVAQKPLFNAVSKAAPFYIAGIAGQQYQDEKFSIPNQSFYIEAPYGDGLLFISATQGPTIDLTPQLLEMLKTLNFSPPSISASLPVEALPSPMPTEAPTTTDLTDADGSPMALVPAGEFTMRKNKQLQKLKLTAYYLDKQEVTNARYKSCVDASVCQPPINASSATRPNYYGNSSFDNYPVIYVNWNMATAYCGWRGARLPAETEWVKAASGTTIKIYPWDQQIIDCSRANYKGCVGDTSAVGSYQSGASVYGTQDMVGNVWEFIKEKDHVVGGAWNNETASIYASSNVVNAEVANHVIGFRCARNAVP